MLPKITLRNRVAAAAAVPVVLAAALGTAWILDQRHQARTQTDSQVRATVATSVTVVRTDLRDQLAAAATAGPGSIVVSASTAADQSLSKAVTASARDSGTATLDDQARTPSIVMPIYRTATAPTSTAERRLEIQSYRVVPLRMQPALDLLVPDAGGISVSGPTRRVAANPRFAPVGSRKYTVDMDLTGAPGWSVTAWRADPGVPA